MLILLIAPAKAGVQTVHLRRHWIPAFVRMMIFKTSMDLF